LEKTGKNPFGGKEIGRFTTNHAQTSPTQEGWVFYEGGPVSQTTTIGGGGTGKRWKEKAEVLAHGRNLSGGTAPEERVGNRGMGSPGGGKGNIGKLFKIAVEFV